MGISRVTGPAGAANVVAPVALLPPASVPGRRLPGAGPQTGDDGVADVLSTVVEQPQGGRAARSAHSARIRRTRAFAEAIPGVWSFVPGAHPGHQALRAYAPYREYLGVFVDVWV